ncbi:MAG: M15 family metallopeptidase [Vulcanococcus sp.]
MAPRPWSHIPIADNGEPLQALPAALFRLEPHPYVAVGAPYGEQASPFRLRQGVIDRLLTAQHWLQDLHPQWRLAVFDAWRPLEVQHFMVQHAIRGECARLGVDPEQPSPQREAVVAEVGRFWAPPSADPRTPPPHSTGAAVDLTLITANGEPLPMGSEIDAIGAVSEPDHFQRRAADLPAGPEREQCLRWHGHREALAAAMAAAGFARHPNEWWHFSHGDQLWAWLQQRPQAIYGRWGLRG